MPPGRTTADVAVFGEPTDVIAFAGDHDGARQDGSFSLEWTPQASGTYDLYLAGGSSFITALKGVYVPAGAAVLYQAVQTGSRAELIELFSDDENRRALLRQEELYGNISKPEELGEAVYHSAFRFNRHS